jgi:uncharacterized protein (TIGR02646 family)
MACIIRKDPPNELIDIQNKSWNKNWYGKRETLLNYLLLETEGYCPFSFAFIAIQKFGEEARKRDDEEIEHFRPKNGKHKNEMYNDKKFSELCFEWSNLFPIISTINKSKGSRWDSSILKPDKDDYLEYLLYNPATGEVDPKPGLAKDKIKRAKATVNIYGLNDSKLCIMRRTHYLEFVKDPSDPHPFKPLFENQ